MKKLALLSLPLLLAACGGGSAPGTGTAARAQTLRPPPRSGRVSGARVRAVTQPVPHTARPVRRQRSASRSGVVLRRWKTPKGDLIVSLLTRQGKLRAIARGGLRGKHAGALNLFHHVGLQVYARPGDELAVIQQASLEGALPRLALPERHPYAHLLAELADLLFQEGEADEYGQQAFDLFAGALRGVAHHHDPEWVALVMSYKLLGLAGILPQTSRCARCGAPDPAHPDPLGGQLLCAQCAALPAYPPEALDFLRGAVRRTVRASMDSPVPPEQRPLLWRALERFVSVQVGNVQSWRQLVPAQA